MLADGPGLLAERLLVPGVVSLEVTALESHCHQVVAGASPSTGTLEVFCWLLKPSGTMAALHPCAAPLQRGHVGQVPRERPGQ